MTALFIQEALTRGQIEPTALELASDDIEGQVEKGYSSTAKPLLRKLDKLPGFSNFVLSRLVGDVDQYLNHMDFRRAVIGRVVTVLQKYCRQEIVLVAHSLGTVVAYDAIDTHPEIPISAFLTLGSPLGIQTYIYQKLLADAQQQRSFPVSITGTWSNFYDSDDLVALAQDLAPLFMRSGKPPVVNIEVTNSPENPHSAYDYLSSKAVGRTIRNLFNVSPGS